MNRPVDFLGREITPGCLTVYAWRRGSRMGLHKLEVTKVTDIDVTGYSPTGRQVTLTALCNVVVVQRPSTEIA